MSHHRLTRIPSRHLGRSIHLWCHGWYGTPVLVMPSASGMAHEWQLGGAVEALRPWLDAGIFKLYCVETNVSESWLSEGSASEKLDRHQAYESFLLDELVPWIDGDCCTPGIPMVVCGVSFGGFLALNLALRHPERFSRVLTLSARYRVFPFLGAVEQQRSLDAYYQQPLAYVPNLTGPALRRVAEKVSGVLVVGRGPHEGRCLPETMAMAHALRSRGLRFGLDVWGDEVSHEWTWWRRQLVHHLPAVAQDRPQLACRIF